MRNILVVGAKGQLGSEIKRIAQNYPYSFFFADKEELDITKKEALRAYLTQHAIEAIINCAAYTAVDKAETEQALCDLINHQAVDYLAALCKELAIKLVHISTDYVYNGQNHQPYVETDLTAPSSVYGQTKLDGECAILKHNPKKTIIIRTSWVYSIYGANFVKTMLRLAKEKESLGVICDQIGTPTNAHDLAQTILEILPKIENQEVEIYHYSNEGVASWYDFAKAILKDSACRINPILTKDYKTAATRPFYSVLNKSKIKAQFGIDIPYWQDSLAAVLNTLKEE